MAEFLAERYEPGETAEQADRAALRLAVAVCELREEGHEIHVLDSAFVPGDESSLTRFHAASAELVAAAHERAGVRVDRIVEVIGVPAGSDRGGEGGRIAAAGSRPRLRHQSDPAPADQRVREVTGQPTTEDRS